MKKDEQVQSRANYPLYLSKVLIELIIFGEIASK